MKDFIKFAWAEAFEGCTPLMIVKRVIAFIVISIVFIVFCGADSVGGFGVAVTIGCAVIVWNFFGLSSAFPDDDKEDTWEEIDNKKTGKNDDGIEL
jgi:hypothetical protein